MLDIQVYARQYISEFGTLHYAEVVAFPADIQTQTNGVIENVARISKAPDIDAD